MISRRLKRWGVIFSLCALFCFNLALSGGRIARGGEQPDYSWLLHSPLKKHLSGAALSYLQRTYGPKKTEKSANPTRAARTLPASEIFEGKSIRVNDPSPDIADNSTQSETSIAVHGDNVVIAWNDAGDFFRNGQFTGYGYSRDGGQTFTDGGPLPLWAASGGTTLGDPSIAADRDGNFYASTLGIDKDFFNIVGVVKSTDGGVIFSKPVNVSGLNPRDFPDKSLLAVDATDSPHSGNIYVVWTNFIFFGQLAQIVFVRSTDGGQTFSAPMPLSAQLADPVQGAIIGVGPSGEVYVTWEDLRSPHSIRLRKSTDGGQSFAPEVLVSTLNPIADPEASSACNETALKGFIRVNEFPSIATDQGNGANRGAIYITYNADPDGEDEGDTSDIFLAHSNDGGQTWSAPVRVNNDKTQNDQFFPSVAVADDGTVSVMWYDRRIDPDNFKIDVFRAVSTDGGETFANERVTTESFGVPPLLPNFNSSVVDCYMGDYNWMTVQGEKFYLSWGDNHRVIVTPKFAQGRPDPDVAFTIASTQTAAAPMLAVAPQSVDFGTVDVGETEERSIVIQNIGSSSLTGTLKAPAAPFAIVDLNGPTLPFKLAPGETLDVQVEFNPDDDGAVTGTIHIDSNDIQHAQLDIQLKGTGKAVVEGPSIRVTPKELDFGNVPSGQRKQLTLTIRNVGTEPLTVKKVSATRSNLFRVLGFRKPQVLQPGRSLRVSVSGRAGANSLLKAKVFIFSDDPENPKLVVAVKLRGVLAGATASLQRVETDFSGQLLHLRLAPALQGKAQFDLYDMAGHRVLSRSFEGAMLDVPATDFHGDTLASGVYLGVIRWVNEQGLTQYSLARRIFLRR
ncbi:choice-of-anchor D domain-containing protein [Candidatus Acetothermia bacterium]|nr:choice-of-anchor D domain-containing protein [Candidatus Acetothermia bacterium]